MGVITHNGEVLQSLPANASQINFDNTGTNLNSTQTENAIKEVNTKVNTNTADINQLKSGLTNLHYHKVAESASTGTYAAKLQSLATAYNNLTLAQKRSALLVMNSVDIYHSVNCSGNWFSVWVDSSAAYLTRYGIDGSAYVETGGTVTDNSSVENANVFSLWICEP
jgi:hypothetical protein